MNTLNSDWINAIDWFLIEDKELQADVPTWFNFDKFHVAVSIVYLN